MFTDACKKNIANKKCKGLGTKMLLQSWQMSFNKNSYFQENVKSKTLFAHQSLLAEQILPVHLSHLAGEIWHSGKA